MLDNNDPFQEITMNLYNQLLDPSSINTPFPTTEWVFLAVDMLLKTHNLDQDVYLKALNGLSSQLHIDHLSWIIGITRKAIKRLGSHGIHGFYLKFICESIKSFLNSSSTLKLDIVDDTLKLLITCKDFGISIAGFEEFLTYCQFKFCRAVGENPLILDLEEEFYFVNTSSGTFNQRIQRHMFIYDPANSKPFPFDYVFELLSFSDEDLVKFFSRETKITLDFYFYLIREERITVDFFVEQLINDSICTLKFLSNLHRRNECPLDVDVDVINFHTLLLLKVDLMFDYPVLNKNLGKFIEKLKSFD